MVGKGTEREKTARMKPKSGLINQLSFEKLLYYWLVVDMAPIRTNQSERSRNFVDQSESSIEVR